MRKDLFSKVNLWQLHCFVGVAEFGSYKMASKALNISQPALSTLIRNLETDLGVGPLLSHGTGVRTTRTRAGDVLLHEAKELLEHFARVLETTRRAAGGGSLRVGISGSMVYGPVP